MSKNKQTRCQGRTLAGKRCKNLALKGEGGFCARHRKAKETRSIIVATYLPPNKSLFRLIVPETKLHPSFEHIRTASGSEPARRMLDDVYQTFVDKDGNFLEQFQTAGFDTRIFELYLFAYLSRSGFTIEGTNAFPDFVIERNGLRVALEATTVNPARDGVVKELGKTLEEVQESEIENYFRNELPIRFGSPLFSKLNKRYWELPHCRERPFVIAIEAFHERDAHLISDNPLISYLYGTQSSASWNPDGSLNIASQAVKSHQLGSKEIPSNFFSQPDTENVSAVIFTNSATNGKFLRMGFQHGFGCETIDMSRSGFWFNPLAEAMDPTFMAYSLDYPPFVEAWSEGLTVLHNPNCRFPVPRDFFVGAVQGYIQDGKFVAEHRGPHPINTKTNTTYLGPDKKELNHLPWRQPPHLAVHAIPKSEFVKLCRYSGAMPPMVAEEQGWFADDTYSFLGVIAHDKTDDDWTWIVLARDESFDFRCMDLEASVSTRDEARIKLQERIARRLLSPRRIFATGHPGGQ